MARLNIQKKLIIPLMSAVIILLVVFSIFIIHNIRVLTEKNVEAKALAELDGHAISIQSFFEIRARIQVTFFQNPFFLDYFRNYHQFRRPVQQDRDYQRLVQYFQTVVKNDSTVKSIFFATDETDEYFDEQGRFEAPGYSAKKRPWWKNAILQNRLYCDNPSFDLRDSTFSTTMQMPLYDKDRLLGIGGIDILITTVNNEINQIRYENQGRAFLIDSEGECIVFPDLNQKLWSFRKIYLLDSLLNNTKGFYGLYALMTKKEKGFYPILYKGLNHIVLFTQVRSNNPFFNWRLGLLVPKHLIDTPSRRITSVSIIIVILFIFCIFCVTLYIAYSITKPLNALAVRLDEMANQKSDLTIELPVETDDAIGLTAKNFNHFIRQIRDVMIRLLDLMKNVAESTQHLQYHSGSMAAETRELSDEAKRVSVTSGIMMQHLDEITKGIKRVSQFSAQGRRSASEGESLVLHQLQRIEAITKEISELCIEMEKLGRKTDSISTAVQTIDDINEQISILSVNASIEAVRAGEFGTGFAVLAEEIKDLSERTSQANAQTGSTVKAFEQDIKKFSEGLLTLNSKIQEEFQFTEELKKTFIGLQNDVSLTDQTTEEIKNETSQQAEAIRSIIQTIHQISETIGQLVGGVSQSFDEIRILDKKVRELKSLTDAFKV